MARRIWKNKTDEEIINIAKQFIEENGIMYRHELEKADLGLYIVLKRRKLIEKVIPHTKYRRWRDKEDSEMIAYASETIKELEVRHRYDLSLKDKSLYKELSRRGLIDELLPKKIIRQKKAKSQ